MSKDEDPTDMAEERTNLAEDRTLMANERTFASWSGMGLGAVGVAIGLKAVFGAFEPTWIAKAVATIFLIAAAMVFWTAQKTACSTYDRLTERKAETQPAQSFTRTSAAMIIGTIGTGIILWAL